MVFIFDETFADAINTFLTNEEKGMLFAALLTSNKEEEYPFENHPELANEKVEIFYQLLCECHQRLWEEYYG